MPGEWTDQIARVQKHEQELRRVARNVTSWPTGVDRYRAELLADADALAALLGIVQLIRLTRHHGVYEPVESSRTGKQQWCCRLCGRLTQAPEHECYTYEMKAVEAEQLATPRSGQE